MESLKSLLLCLLVVFLSTKMVFATSQATPIQSASSDIKYVIETYAKEHQGKMALSWQEMDDFFIKREQAKNPNQTGRSSLFSGIDSLLGRSLEESFTLLHGTPVEMLTPNKNEIFQGGVIVAIGNAPVSEDRREGIGRYLIWRDPRSGIRSSWLNESLLKSQFEKAGVKLPSQPILKQPPTFDKENERLGREYGKKHFKNPQAPTTDEIDEFKDYLASTGGELPSPTPDNSTPIPDRTAPEQTLQSTQKPAPKATPAPRPSSQASSSIWLGCGTLLLLGIIGFCVYRQHKA